MAVRAHQSYPILRTVIEDLATPYRPETMVREPGANFEDVGVWRRHPVEDRYVFFHQGFVDVVLAYAVDRLSRNQIHIAVLLDDIEKVGATLEFVTEDFENTPVGRLILNVRAFAGEVERDKITERTMRGKIERARGWEAAAGDWEGVLRLPL